MMSKRAKRYLNKRCGELSMHDDAISTDMAAILMEEYYHYCRERERTNEIEKSIADLKLIMEILNKNDNK